MVRKRKIYYCQYCQKWRGSSKECSECKKETIEKELPLARGNFYFIDGIDRPLPRVTNILKILDKPGLNFWKQKVLIETALADPTLSTQEIIAATYKERDEAGDKGLDIHEIIQALSKGEPVDEKIISEIPQIQGYRKFCETVPHRVLESELVVYSEKHSYAGTLDCLIQVCSNAVVEKEDVERAQKAGYEIIKGAGPFTLMRKYGKTWMIDFKSGNGIYGEHHLQLSAYKFALQEMKPKMKIDGLAIVHLQKDGNFAFLEARDCFDVFEAVLKIYNWMNEK